MRDYDWMERMVLSGTAALMRFSLLEERVTECGKSPSLDCSADKLQAVGSDRQLSVLHMSVIRWTHQIRDLLRT